MTPPTEVPAVFSTEKLPVSSTVSEMFSSSMVARMKKRSVLSKPFVASVSASGAPRSSPFQVITVGFTATIASAAFTSTTKSLTARVKPGMPATSTVPT